MEGFLLGVAKDDTHPWAAFSADDCLGHNRAADWRFVGTRPEMSSVPVNISVEDQCLHVQLREAQGRLQLVADAAGSLIGKLEFAVQPHDNLVLVSADEMADQLLGKPCASFFGQPLLALLPGLQLTQIPAALRGVALTGTLLGPLSLMGEGIFSGKVFNLFAFQLAPGRAVVKFWDSCGAVESQQTGMRSRQQLAAVFSQSPVAISLSRERDGVYVDVNDEWSRLTGLSLQDVIGRTSVELGFWTDSLHREAMVDPLRASGQLRNLDLSFARTDGGKLTLQLDISRIELGGKTYFLSYFKDVTSERSVQTALLASEQLLKATNSRLNQQISLFESMERLASVGYWTSGPDGGGLCWSNGLYSLTGREPGTVLDSETGRSRIHDEDRKKFEVARGNVDDSTVEYRSHHPDGRLHWLRSRMRRWSQDGAEVIDFGVVQDITDEREAALALQEKLGFIQKITSCAPGLVFQLRLQADGAYKFLYVSDPLRTIYRGVTPEEVIQNASCALKLHHPDDLSGFTDSIRASARDLTPWNHEYRLQFDDGEVRWLLGQAIPEREPDGAVLWNGFTTDITLRKQAEEGLRDSEARFRALTELSSDWYWEQDENFRFIRVDGNVDLPNTLPPDSYIGITRWESRAQGVSQAQWAVHRAALEAHETFHDFELQRRRADGTLMWVTISGTPIFDTQGNFKGYRGIGRDISGRKQAEEKIERLAFYDVLTGLPNRRLLMDRLQHALVTSAREKSTGALLFIDLDNFKDLNDSQGHDVGDLLLKQVAQRLVACVREADTVGRLGGDEFVVMLQSLDSDVALATAQVEYVGKKIIRQLNQVYLLGTLEHHSTPSIGVTLFEDHVQTG